MQVSHHPSQFTVSEVHEKMITPTATSTGWLIPSAHELKNIAFILSYRALANSRRVLILLMLRVWIAVKGEQEKNHKYGKYNLNESTVKSRTRIHTSLCLTLLGSRSMFLFEELNSYHSLLRTSQQARHIISKGESYKSGCGKDSEN